MNLVGDDNLAMYHHGSSSSQHNFYTQTLHNQHLALKEGEQNDIHGISDQTNVITSHYQTTDLHNKENVGSREAVLNHMLPTLCNYSKEQMALSGQDEQRKDKPHSESINTKSNQNKSVHECPFCKKVFKQKSHLNHHKRVKHLKGEHLEKFRCKECDRKFTCTSSLKNHMMLHNDERPFSCNLCEKRFVQELIFKTEFFTICQNFEILD